MDNSNPQFGLVVAYLLPGFIGLGGIVLLVPAIRQWLQPIAYQGAAGIAPPIYAILAAIAMGMILSCFRWVIVDHLHAWMGLVPPPWNSTRLEQNMSAVNFMVQHHYRYYQFYANTLIAVIWTYGINRAMGSFSFLGLVTDLGLIVLCVVLFAGSRDALSKYYARTSRLISTVAEKDVSVSHDERCAS